MKVTVKILEHGETIRVERYETLEAAEKEMGRIEKEAHRTHSLWNVIVQKNGITEFERFFG